MDNSLIILLTILALFFSGILAVFLKTRQVLNDKYEKRINELSIRHNDKEDDLNAKCDSRIKKAEQASARKQQELNDLIEYHRARSKEIMNRAVEYAFNFESEFQREHQTAQIEIQKVLDDSYRFKAKTLLSSVSLKNFEKKLDELIKERDKYRSLIVNYAFFKLTDNSDWKAVENDLRDKALKLQEAMDEREAQNEIKRQMREERTRIEELERQQLEAEKKEIDLEERKAAIQHALLEASEEHRKELEAARKLLEDEIVEVHKQYERAKSMAQMTRQGHVYVISNIGSFGENVFKIGMTRRLEPLDRIYELSSASVPFEFDVHAMISCDDAPTLESVLHAELSENRINKVNTRKEFFRTDIQKIIDVVKHHHGVVEYVANPAALQYYKSLETEALQEPEEETVIA